MRAARIREAATSRSARTVTGFRLRLPGSGREHQRCSGKTFHGIASS